MSYFKVYLKPFDDEGEYVEDWTEVTEDVNFDSIGDIRQSIDDDEYDVGVFKFSDFQVELRNEHGRYSDVDGIKSIFKYKRLDSLVRVTWILQDAEPYAGVAIAGDTIAGNDEIEVFQGLLSDEASETDIRAQTAVFRVRGLESIFASVDMPFSDIANGMLISEIIKKALDQDKITDLLNYDPAKILPGNDVIVDDVSDYQNRTVKEVLSDLLLISNSVLYIKDGAIYVSARSAGADIQATFYGQASNKGIENIVSIENVRTGLNQTFNYWTWEDTTLVAKDLSSINLYGVRKKEIGHSAITNNVRRALLLDELKDEFRIPKTSMDLRTTLMDTHLALNILDRITIDYPTVFYTIEQTTVPIYGVSHYGESAYPLGEWSLTLGDNEPLKITGKIIKVKDQLIEYHIKRI